VQRHCRVLVEVLSFVKCTATYSLAKYQSHQSRIATLSNYTAQVHNNDLFAAACTTIVFCVLVATLFGADFFFLVFWPRRRYPLWYNVAKVILAVGITLGMAAASLMTTVGVLVLLTPNLLLYSTLSDCNHHPQCIRHRC
jgi:hypothetical protein